MAKVDRSILQANDQNMGDFGDPNKLESSISHLADTIDGIDNDTSTLKTDNTSHKNRLTALESDVFILETDNTSNKSKITTLEGDNANNKNRLTTLETDNTSNKSRISTNESNIAYNEGRLVELLRNEQKASEVVDARMGFPVLRDKLENVDAQIAERTDYLQAIGYDIRWNALLALDGDWTDAFNAATRATEEHIGNNTDLKRVIYVPPGEFTVRGKVFVRKGQSIQGAGEGVSRIIIPNDNLTDTFILGKGLVNGVEIDDPGGLAVTVENLGFEGGLHTVISTNAAGYFIRNCMFTACGTSMVLSGGDGVISDIIIDMGLNGIVIENAQNILIDNLLIYQCNYGVSFKGNVYDVQIRGLHSEYIEFSSVIFNDEANIVNLQLSDLQCLLNAQNVNFNGFILDRSNQSDYKVSNGVFRNMKGYAIKDDSGIGHKGIFENCVFDGYKTNGVYDQSTTSAGVLVKNSNITLVDCVFRNLNGFAVSVEGTFETKFSWNGGKIENCPTEPSVSITNNNELSAVYLQNVIGQGKQLFNAQSAVKVQTKNLSNCVKYLSDANFHYCLIPYQSSKVYRLGVKANVNPGGNTDYIKSSVYIIGVQLGYTSQTVTVLDSAALFKASANFLGELAPTFSFDSPTGGATKNGHFKSGMVCVAVPVGYGSFSITVDEII